LLIETEEKIVARTNSRREFFYQSLRAAGKLSIASMGIYAIGSMTKDLGGSFVAGAKCSAATFPTNPCPPSKSHWCCGDPSDPSSQYWGICGDEIISCGG
jgi:hypothetical protein